jgi:hypothetical protein
MQYTVHQCTVVFDELELDPTSSWFHAKLASFSHTLCIKEMDMGIQVVSVNLGLCSEQVGTGKSIHSLFIALDEVVDAGSLLADLKAMSVHL